MKLMGSVDFGATSLPPWNTAGVGRIDSCQYFDHSRLARAVLSEQRMDLAAPDVEIHTIKRQRSGKLLAEPRDDEQPDRRKRRLILQS